MNEALALLIVYIIFILFSFLYYRLFKLKSVKNMLKIALTIIYLVGIYGIFEGFNQLHYYLRDNKILYIEFGHASLDLILFMFFCYLNSAFVIGISVKKVS